MAAEVEPWLRGTHTELDPIRRAVVHALELAGEDLRRWCGELSDEELDARPSGLPPVAYQLRHIGRSLDRLLTYAEGKALSEAQLAALRTELEGGATRTVLFVELEGGLKAALARVIAFAPESYGEARGVGRAMLPATVGGLLVHCAEHTQRHVGQAVTTAKVVIAGRAS